jgi:hypothetical protein
MSHKYIAWLNGTSVKAGTLAECESHALYVFSTTAWQNTHVGKPTILRITTYGAQRLVSETNLSGSEPPAVCDKCNTVLIGAAGCTHASCGGMFIHE